MIINISLQPYQKVDKSVTYGISQGKSRITMLHNWGLSQTAAILDSSRIAIGNCDTSLASWSRLDDTAPEVTVGKISAHCRAAALLTSDKRILFSFNGGGLDDITQLIYDIFGEAIEIRDVRIHNLVLIVIAKDMVGVIGIEQSLVEGRGHGCEAKAGLIHQFPCEIDTYSAEEWIWGWSVVKTVDGNLYWFSEGDCINPSLEPEQNRWSLQKLRFDKGNSVCEIFVSYRHILLLMCGGGVYVMDIEDDRPVLKDRVFKLLVFCEGVEVLKVIQSVFNAFFVTNTGSCYHLQEGSDLRVNVIQSLHGYFVEEVYPIVNRLVIRHDGGRICVLQIDARHEDPEFNSRVRKQYINGTAKPRSIPFFDNKGIASIRTLSRRIYFVTSEGSTYWVLWKQLEAIDLEDLANLSIIHEDFFDMNPLAVSNTSAKIRSAGSMLNDKN